MTTATCTELVCLRCERTLAKFKGIGPLPDDECPNCGDDGVLAIRRVWASVVVIPDRPYRQEVGA